MQYNKIMKDLREDNDLTQKQIAKVLNIKHQQYSRYEKGDTELPIHYLIQLADFYHVSTDYLLGREQ